MSGDETMGLIYGIGMLVLVGSSLAIRKVPLGQGLKMAAAWILIFAIVFAGFLVKDDVMALGARMWSDIRGEAPIVQAGDQLRIRKAPDGHFWLDAELNGEKIRFMVDSGASYTSIGTETARKAGIETGMRMAQVDTANGVVVARRARADLEVGSIERPGHALLVAEEFGKTNVLGMNFLSSLSGWGVEGQWLVLKP